MSLLKWLTDRKDALYVTKPGHQPIPLKNVAWATQPGDAVPFGQAVVINPNTNTITPAYTWAALQTFSGGISVTGNATISGTLGVAVINPFVAGKGTSIQVPVTQGQTFAAPVTLTPAMSGGTFLSDAAAGTKWILPAATVANVGCIYKFKVTATVTSNSFDVEGATSADLFVAGSNVFQTKAATDGVLYSPNGSSNYKYTSNGTTTGGIIGDVVEFLCVGLNQWLVNGTMSGSGTVATPFNG